MLLLFLPEFFFSCLPFNSDEEIIFYVSSIDAIPAELLFLLPSQYVDSGNKYIRVYAPFLTEFNSSDIEKLQSLYHFLVFGDTNGPFNYEYYKDAYPDFADPVYSNYYLASHMLINRRGTCNDFSELFVALARTSGFRVQLVSGHSAIDEPGHQWNRVWANEGWYRVDATWGNGNPARFKSYAEFYSEFDTVTFEAQHEKVYMINFIERF